MKTKTKITVDELYSALKIAFDMDIEDFKNYFDTYLGNTDHRKQIFDKYKPIEVVNIVHKYLKEKEWKSRLMFKRENLSESCSYEDYRRCMMCMHYEDDFDCRDLCVPYDFDRFESKNQESHEEENSKVSDKNDKASEGFKVSTEEYHNAVKFLYECPKGLLSRLFGCDEVGLILHRYYPDTIVQKVKPYKDKDDQYRRKNDQSDMYSEGL